VAETPLPPPGFVVTARGTVGTVTGGVVDGRCNLDEEHYHDENGDSDDYLSLLLIDFSAYCLLFRYFDYT